ncbi:MAG: hypothetical protein ACJAS1_001493 [Oleiphilaceae bacterium]|jgi:hypothetical protein
MARKIPEAGHVIKYSYLWWNEHRKEKIEGLGQFYLQLVGYF